MPFISRKIIFLLFWVAAPTVTFAGLTDPLTQVPVEQVDLGKYNSKTLPDIKVAYENFTTRQLPLGAKAPDFTLDNLAGEKISLHQFLGKKPVLLIFGSAGCYVYRRNAMLRTAELRRRLAGKLEVLTIYTLEAHPALDPSPYTGHQWTSQANVEDRVLVRQPRRLEERSANALALAERYRLDRRGTLVDNMDNSVWREYGEMPDEVYLIDKDGKITYKNVWAHFDAPDFRRALGLPLSAGPAATDFTGHFVALGGNSCAAGTAYDINWDPEENQLDVDIKLDGKKLSSEVVDTVPQVRYRYTRDELTVRRVRAESRAGLAYGTDSTFVAFDRSGTGSETRAESEDLELSANRQQLVHTHFDGKGAVSSRCVLHRTANLATTPGAACGR